MFKKGKGQARRCWDSASPVLTGEGDVTVDPATAALPMSLPEPVANTRLDPIGRQCDQVDGPAALGTSLGRAFSVQAGRGSTLTAVSRRRRSLPAGGST